MLSTICGKWSRLWLGGSNKSNDLSEVILAASVTILTIFWLLWAFKKLIRSETALLPPGPRGLPLVGYLPFLGADLHLSFTELAQVYGPIFKLWLGNKLCVVISSPALIKEVVRDQDITFANRDPTIAASIFSYGGTDIAFASYGPDWRMLRKILKHQMLSNVNLDSLYSLRRHEVGKGIRGVYSKIGTPIDFGELTSLTMINTTMSMLWGGTLEGEKGTSLGAEFGVVVSEIVDLLEKPNVSDFFPVLARFDVQRIERKMKKILHRVERILDVIVDERMKMDEGKVEGARKTKGKDFLQFLLELKDQEDTASRSITQKQVKALLTDIVVGGNDTMSSTVEWVMAEMMQHPKVMKKAHEELTYVVGVNNIVEEFHLPKLRYLDAIVKETLRLRPAVPLLVPRCPNQSSTVGGYTIPKGTKIFLNVWAMHRDPQFWDTPSEFWPERFLSDTTKFDYSGTNFCYLPFGSGRRICAGIPLAERMVMYVLASFLHSFEWKLPNGTVLDLSEKFGIALKRMTPLVAIPTPRLSNLELYGLRIGEKCIE